MLAGKLSLKAESQLTVSAAQRSQEHTALAVESEGDREKVELDKMTVFGNDEVFGTTGIFHFLLINSM